MKYIKIECTCISIDNYMFNIYMYYIYISNLGLWDAPPVVFQVFTSGIEKTPVILGEISAGT